MSEKHLMANIVADPDYPGELLLEFPPDLVDQLGWEIGDTLTWDMNSDGTVSVKKVV